MVAKTNSFNPYPGLRAFNFDEGELFFGREELIKKIITNLTANRFFALIGPAGSGKSSLISAGIVPVFNQKSYHKGIPSRQTIYFRPGSDPTGNLARALVNSGIYSDREKTGESLIRFTGERLKQDPDGLNQILENLSTSIEGGLVIIIDRFEELYLSPENNSPGFAASEKEIFIDLITKLQKQEIFTVDILIAIRSDFIAELQVSPGLTGLVNKSNHFLSPLSDEGLHEVIHKPAAIGGGQIDASLERQIIYDLQGKQNLLPSLQYLLNKLWNYGMTGENYDNPISLKEYQAVGNIYDSLPADADSAYEGLTDAGETICQRLFKTIAIKDSRGREISYPRTIEEIASVAGESIENTIEVIERFRQPGKTFIITSNETELNAGTLIELSHESIIWLWPRLNRWVGEEAESIKMFKLLSEKSRLYQIRKTTLMVTPELQLALKWREDNKPSAEWARLYNSAFERTMIYLNKSEDEFRKAETDQISKPLRKMRRAQIAAVVFALAAVFSIGLAISNSGLYLASKTPLSNTELSQSPSQINNDQEASSDYDDQLSELTGRDNETDFQGVPELSTRGGTREQGYEEHIPTARLNDQVSGSGTRRPDSDSSVPDHVNSSSEESPISEEARNKKLVDIGRSLISSSSEIINNPHLKALLAVQAQAFIEQADDSYSDPALYTSLHSALKTVYGNSFNAFKGHSGSVNAVIFRPNSSIFYSASSDGKVLRWDLNDMNRKPETLLENSGINNNLAISSNGQWLAVATNGQGIKIINPTRNVPFPVIINRGNNRFSAMDFHPDNQHIIFADSENNIVKYNITTGNSQVITKAGFEVFSLSVSPDGRNIAAGTRGGQVIIWTGETDPVKRVIHHDPGNDVHVVQFNHNGTQLASGNLRGNMRIWEVLSGSLIRDIDGHSARLVDIKFSPDNNKIASTSFDGTVKLWDMNNIDAEPLILSDHGSWVLSVSFNSSGTRMVSGGRQENRLMGWYLDKRDMASEICSGIPRNLTSEEWNRYIGNNIPYMETCPR